MEVAHCKTLDLIVNVDFTLLIGSRLDSINEVIKCLEVEVRNLSRAKSFHLEDLARL